MRARPGSYALVAACLLAQASPARANTSTGFPTGSIIIPTTAAFQDDCGAVSAYGLVYDVLRANTWLAANGYHTITIYYAYLDTKASPNRCVPTSLDSAPSGAAAWNDGCDITGVAAGLITNNNHNTAATNIVTLQTAGVTTTSLKCSGGTSSGSACPLAAAPSSSCPGSSTSGDCKLACTHTGGGSCSASCVHSGSAGTCTPGASTCKAGTPNSGSACTFGSTGDTFCNEYSCALTTTSSSAKTNTYPGFPTHTVTSANTVNYLGGPFIISAGNSGAGGTDVDVFRKLLDGTISAQDASSNVIDFTAFRTRSGTQIAPPASSNLDNQCAFGTDHYVNIHLASAGFTANVGKAFQNPPPRLALLTTDKNNHTGTVDDGILQNYLKNAGLDFSGAGGCATGTVNTANCPGHCSTSTSISCLVSSDCGGAQTCVGGGTVKSGQIYDAFDFDDLAGHLTTTSYTMLWTPHWQTNATLLSQETAAFAKIGTFLDGQTGLAAQCASVSSFEGATFTSGATSIEGTNGNAMQLQTCGGAGTTCSGTVAQGLSGNPNAPYGTPTLNSHILFDNCSNPTMTTGTGCVYFPYPGDSFVQIGDYRWDAEGGWITGFLPQSSAGSIYTKSVVPLVSLTTLTAGNQAALQAAPGSYDSVNFVRSGTDLATRALTGGNAIVADLATRSIKGATAGKANILYLGGHDQTSPIYGVAGTRMMLQTLLQLGISTLPPTTTSTEVSRNSPIVATISATTAVVQGTYELVSPAPSATTYSANGDSATFKFPAIKGHLRARTASTITTTGSTFASSGILFDAAAHIPDPTAAGCSTWYTSSCRTVFTTLATGAKPTIHYLKTGEVGAGSVGEAMATNSSGAVDLDTANEASLIQRVLAGDDSAVTGSFKPALGGVDRSTVAVIESSARVNSTRPTMAYFGADDGMLHAVCASTGNGCDVLGRELWAYLPRTELGLVRYNKGRIDGSPRVFDAFVSDGAGLRSWRTVLVFQTGTGDTTLQSRVPAVYALDVSNPSVPTVLWEYSLASVSSRGNFELGQGLTVAAGQIQTGTVPKFMVFAQTNNAGTLTNGNVVTAINVDTGLKEWQNGYQFTTSLRAGGTTVPPVTGIPGGAVGVDKTLSGYISDLVYATLYGDLWEVDPATGLSRYAPGTLPGAGNPLLRFSTDNHPIGVTPAIYTISAGGAQYAAFVTGGYTDSYPNDTSWTTAGTTQYVMGVNLSTPATDATINENKGTTGTTTSDIPIKFPLGAGEAGYAQVSVIDGLLYVSSDTADVNNSGTGGYGLGGSSGHVYAAAVGGTGLSLSTVVVEGGASSVVATGTTVYSGASNQQQQLAAAATGTGNPVEITAAAKMTRRLWLRTQ